MNLNIKLSKKRRLILQVFETGHLFTANDICKLLPNIDRATIYRALRFFVEKKLIREVNVQKGLLSYELNIDSHEHFFCECCGQVISIKIDNVFIEYLRNFDFQVNSFEVLLRGKCRNCSQKVI